MAGTLKSNVIQLGDDPVPSRNFVIRTNVDGTLTIARGNAGATSQDILTINAAGVVAMPATHVSFSAHQSVQQAIGATGSKVLFQVEDFDTANAFAASRFTAPIAGPYLVTWRLQIVGVSNLNAVLLKNNVVVAYGTYQSTLTQQNPLVVGVTMIWLAVGDYLEVWGDSSDPGGTSSNTLASTAFAASFLGA